MIPKISFLICDFSRPHESATLLRSLHDKVKLPKKDFLITYLANGGDYRYSYEFFQDNLIDQLIIRNFNSGGSFGMRDLASLCQSEYAFLLQNDQYLIEDITPEIVEYFTGLLSFGYKCVDLAGAQAGANTYSDRAQFIKISDYIDWIKNFKHAGPGYEIEGEDHNEGLLQKKFQENEWKIAHINPIFFKDNGKWSVREHDCSGVTAWRTDTKELRIIKPLKRKYSYMKLNDDEWDLILKDEWIDGTIPENWKKDSFNYFE